MTPNSRRLALAAVAVLAAACSSEQSITDPSLARSGPGGSQLTATPNAVEFGFPPGGSEVVTVAAQYLTTVTASSSNTGCATVTPATTPTKKPKGSSSYVATFTVAAAGEGTCTITMADKNGKSTTVQVTVVPPLPDRIVYTVATGGASDIFVMGLDGSNPTPLTATADEYEVSPQLSPDGRKILFIHPNAANTVRTPTLMAVDGTGRVALPVPALNGIARFSPDGKRVAFAARVNEKSRIFTSDLTGTNPIQVTTGTGFPEEHDPSWAGPLPGRIAFLRDVPRSVWIMNADGSSQLALVPGGDSWLHGPVEAAVSPDGQRVALECQVTIHDYDICIVNADGTGRTQLTDATGRDRDPRWTRDGRIIFTSERDGNNEVYIMNADGSGQTNLTNSAGDEGTASPF